MIFSPISLQSLRPLRFNNSQGTGSNITGISNIVEIDWLPKNTLEERMEVFKVMKSNQVRDVGRNEVEGSLRFTLHLAPIPIGDFSRGGAGLFNLSAAFKFVGEGSPYRIIDNAARSQF
jgi:hypothetical protein